MLPACAFLILLVASHTTAGVLKLDSSSDATFTLPASQQSELNSSYWLQLGTDFVQRQRTQLLNKDRAKNVILFLGDGMSVATLAATRAYLGGEQLELPFERFPTVGMARTYCVNAQVADSACTSTAYLSGIKGNIGTIGVSAAVPRGSCDRPDGRGGSIAAWAQQAGVATGLVTTTRVTHASPAGVYAHSAERRWENDAMVSGSGCRPEKVADVARQLVHGKVGAKLRVVLGGGRENFLNKTLADEEGGRGRRQDGHNLIKEWLRDKRLTGARKHYVWNKVSLMGFGCGFLDWLF